MARAGRAAARCCIDARALRGCIMSFLKGGVWIAGQISFVGENYLSGGDVSPEGGGHFFYGNRFFLASGSYLASVHFQKPRNMESIRVIVEVLNWREDSSEVLSKVEFNVSGTAVSILVPILFA